MRHMTGRSFAPGEVTRLLTPVSEADYEEAAALLKDGELVAFPTETVYGLGAAALNPSAVAKIFAAKGRPADNPLIVHVARVEDIPALVREIPPMAEALIRAFMPGPITLVLKKNARVPDLVSAGLPTVGIRMPSHPVALRLLEKVGEGVAAPSANLSGSPSPTLAEHVYKDLAGRIPMILDGGPCDVGLESTVVDCTGDRPVILRPGAITAKMIDNILLQGGTGQTASADAKLPKDGSAPRSPGMKYRHYAPRSAVRIIAPSVTMDTSRTLLVKCERSLMHKMGTIGVFLGNKAMDYVTKHLNPELLSRTIFYPFGEDTDVKAASRKLFDGLRTLDDAGVDEILAVAFPDDGLGNAYMNRLRKAASVEGVNESPEQTVGDIPKKVLFVCTGNTCRSPMAQAAFNARVLSRGPYRLAEDPTRFARPWASSAGIFAEDGNGATDNAVRAARNVFAMDLSMHSSRKTTGDLMKDAEIVFAMTREHAAILRRVFPDFSTRIFSLSEYFAKRSVEPIHTGVDSKEIGDPFGASLITYEETARSIDRILSDAWPYIMEDLGVEDLFVD